MNMVKMSHWFCDHVPTFLFPFSKSKHSMQTAPCDLHIKICLETKLYIFLKLFYYFLDSYKLFLNGSESSKNSNFVNILKIYIKSSPILLLRKSWRIH